MLYSIWFVSTGAPQDGDGPFMDFSVPHTLEDLLADIRQFVATEICPLEAALAAGSFADLLPGLHEKRELVKERGWWAPHVPKQHGGMGLSFMEFAFVGEELGRSPLGHYVFNCQAPDAGNMEILMAFGTDQQKEHWLDPLVRGEIRSCFAMTEPEYPGSNPVWMATTAEKDGGDYVINGRKWFTTAADGASFAIVMAVTDGDAEPRRRASQIIVPTDTPGFTIVRNIPVMGHTGDGWFSHSEIAYTDCRVPRENLLGDAGAGFAIAQARLGAGRIHHCRRRCVVRDRHGRHRWRCRAPPPRKSDHRAHRHARFHDRPEHPGDGTHR